MYNKYNFIDACHIGEKIIFKYNKKDYIVNKANNYYLFNKDDNNYQYFSEANELIEKGIVEGKQLKEILDYIEISFIDFDTKKEFIAATMINREIEFSCRGVDYFKSCSDKGYYIANLKDNTVQYFKTPKELLENCRLEGKALSELWNEINIQCLY